ncbi:MAG: hypothetical protein HY072_07110, partial [Deltaproteobacteria bacterium]|nr:hypothetical protein [Deltaproteobacteria bacterium]
IAAENPSSQQAFFPIQCKKLPNVTSQMCLESTIPNFSKVGCRDLESISASENTEHFIHTLKSSNCQPIILNSGKKTCPQGYKMIEAPENLKRFSIYLSVCIK